MDIDEDNLTAAVYNSKGHTDSTIFITEKLMKELLLYKSFCRTHYKELGKYVFVNRYNEQMTQNSIALLLVI